MIIKLVKCPKENIEKNKDSESQRENEGEREWQTRTDYINKTLFSLLLYKKKKNIVNFANVKLNNTEIF